MELDNFLNIAHNLIHKNKDDKNSILVVYYIKANTHDQLDENYEVIEISEEEINLFKNITIQEVLRRLGGDTGSRVFIG